VVKLVIRNKRQGRHVQSKMAKLTGGKNVGTIEGQDLSYHDKPWSIEVKHRKTFIGNTFMDQADKNAPKGKVPLVIVHTKNQRYMKSVVLIRLDNWIDWFGTLEVKNEES
jgi:hypothetical protein